MDSVRQRHYASLEENLAIIAEGIREGVDLRTTPLEVSLPLEVDLMLDMLRQGGVDLQLGSQGVQRAVEFYEAFRGRRDELHAVMQRIFADKKAIFRMPEGRRVLLADQLWRSVEFVGEAARTIQIISTQKELDSPAQHPHPGVGDVAAIVGPNRR